MKKRFLSAAVAAILTVTGMATTAFAQGEVTEATAAAAAAVTEASNTITVNEITSIPAINVKLPTTVAYVANPYRLTVKTGEDANGDPITSNAAIVSPELEVENLGHSRIAVSALGIGTPSGKANLVSLSTDAKGKTVTAIDAKKNTNDILLFIEPGTAKADKDGNITYTFAGKYAEKNCCLIGSESSTAYYAVGDVTEDAAKSVGVTADEWATANNATKKGKLLFGKGVALTETDGTAITNADDIDGDEVTDIVDKENSVFGTATEVTLLTLDNVDSTDAKAVTKGRIKISGDMNSNVAKDWADTDTVAIALKFNVKLLPNTVK